MKNTTNEKPQRGRPRKAAAELKSKRMAVAMTGAEHAAAERLAAELDTTVSSAIAQGVGIALDSVLHAKFIQRLVDGLTAAAKETADPTVAFDYPDDDSGIQYGVAQAVIGPVSRALLLVSFVGSRRSVVEQSATDIVRVYDDAIRRFAENIAQSWKATGRLDGPVPYTAANCRVYFGFNVEQGTDKVYAYGTPLEQTDGSFAQQQ
jgi:hypothetical protein